MALIKSGRQGINRGASSTHHQTEISVDDGQVGKKSVFTPSPLVSDTGVGSKRTALSIGIPTSKKDLSMARNLVESFDSLDKYL